MRCEEEPNPEPEMNTITTSGASTEARRMFTFDHVNPVKCLATTYVQTAWNIRMPKNAIPVPTSPKAAIPKYSRPTWMTDVTRDVQKSNAPRPLAWKTRATGQLPT